jgi:GNAT superfamily N-acetyltransferase
VIFIDTHGRPIEIEGDYDVEAFHNGKRIGRIEFDDRDGDAVLWGINVDPAYRRAGIGTEVMRLAAELHGMHFVKPSLLATGADGASSDSYYTREGGALIQHCIDAGILENTEPRE